MCLSLWDRDEVEWVGQPASAGGLLILWDKGCFELKESFEGHHFVVVEGWWGIRSPLHHQIKQHFPH